MRPSSKYPSIEEFVADGPESTASIRVHRSLRSMYREFFWLSCALGAVYMLQVAGSVFRSSNHPSVLLLAEIAASRWVLIIPALVLLETGRRYYDNLYILERERITHHSGLLSLRYFVPSIRYYDIRAVKVSQGLIGRLLNFGDIELSTAAQDKAEVMLWGVYAPIELSNLVEDMQSWHRGDGAHGDVGLTTGQSEGAGNDLQSKSAIDDDAVTYGAP
jgi:membrane protein YdbS with pleckstrin-like domain